MDTEDRSGTPEARNGNGVRIVGTLVILALVIAVLLLALGVFDFEQRGWFQ